MLIKPRCSLVKRLRNLKWRRDMRITLFVIGITCLLASGCQVIPTDMVPKVKWY